MQDNEQLCKKMNVLKKSWKKEKLALIIALFLAFSQAALAADPGHGASVIGSGTFESRRRAVILSSIPKVMRDG